MYCSSHRHQLTRGSMVGQSHFPPSRRIHVHFVVRNMGILVHCCNQRLTSETIHMGIMHTLPIHGSTYLQCGVIFKIFIHHDQAIITFQHNILAILQQPTGCLWASKYINLNLNCLQAIEQHGNEETKLNLSFFF